MTTVRCIALAVAEDITDQVQSENRLRRLSQRLVTVLDDERARIARELHDQVGQELTAIGINMGIIEMHTRGNAQTAPHVEDATELVSTVIQRLRTLISDLRPLALDEMGLHAALRWYCERFSLRTGIPVSLQGDWETLNLTPAVNNTLYQIATEALTNVGKHAHARHADITLEMNEQHLALSIRDDGSGFDVDEALNAAYRNNWGIQIMQERVNALIGSLLVIESTPGAGTLVRVEAPL
ncbi:MAG: sensor histidine kinase [Caldilineaceae bacterium]